MKFSDIVTLAKAGYKPSDVKDLLELCETDPKVKDKEPPEDVKDEKKESDKNDSEKDIIDAFEKLAKS